MSILSENIKTVRLDLKLSQLDFASKLGYSTNSAVSHWELDKRKPEPEDLVKIAVIGDVTLDWLLTGGPEIIHKSDMVLINAKDSQVNNTSRDGNMSYSKVVNKQPLATDGNDPLVSALNKIIELKDKEIQHLENRIEELEDEIEALRGEQ